MKKRPGKLYRARLSGKKQRHHRLCGINSPLFDEAQYIVTCDHAITADDVHIKWTTLMGSTEASEKDEIGLAHVSISKDGEVFNEKTISFVAKAVNAVTDDDRVKKIG